jgi:hypothetical protein
LNLDCYRCTMSLRSELRLIRTLLRIAKRCLTPKLKSYALELHARKVALMLELKIRSKAEKALDSARSLIQSSPMPEIAGIGHRTLEQPLM